MSFQSQSGLNGLWPRFTLAAILVLVAWSSWPLADILSPEAGSLFGVVGMTLVAGFLSKLRFGSVPDEIQLTPSPDVAAQPETPPDADPISVLVENMLVQGRQALLLRPELATNLTSQQRQRAQHDVSDTMALVAEGDVRILPWEFDEDPAEECTPIQPRGGSTSVDSFWLDRLQVSNLQFQIFVDQGGYDNESLWSVGGRKQVSNFVDKTQMSGPLFWEQGRFPAGLGDHPVVGICWYEAEAFARWQGKRLPSDAEWMIAAGGPLSSDDSHSVQREYPWGRDPKPGVANLWGSELANGCKVGTVPTNSLPAGATNAGIQQLLGNVWEWMASEFQISSRSEEVILNHPVKSLRGGAYDSYFGDQATCQLQSGDCPLARKHNIGIRCAVTASDLVSTDPSSSETT